MPASSPASASRFNSAVAPLAPAGTMYNLGPQPRLDVWIDPERPHPGPHGSRSAAARPLQIAEGVVNLKAEYGVDVDADGTISAAEWRSLRRPTGNACWRFGSAVLVRSRQFERNGDTGASGVRAVTPTANNPYYFGDPVGHQFLMTNVDGTADTSTDIDGRSEQLALLPLSRLRARDPVAQHALGELRMKRASIRSARSLRRQHGVVLFVAPHRAHRHDAGRAGAAQADGRRHVDRGQRRVQGERHVGRRPRHRSPRGRWIIANSADHGQRFVRGRLSLELDERRRNPTAFDWDNQSRTLIDDQAQTGNTTRLIIQRLCETPNMSALDPAQRCSDSPVLNAGDSNGGGGYPAVLPGSSPAPFFRVTTRVDGPRNTVSYTQVLMQ